MFSDLLFVSLTKNFRKWFPRFVFLKNINNSRYFCIIVKNILSQANFWPKIIIKMFTNHLLFFGINKLSKVKNPKKISWRKEKKLETIHKTLEIQFIFELSITAYRGSEKKYTISYYQINKNWSCAECLRPINLIISTNIEGKLQLDIKSNNNKLNTHPIRKNSKLQKCTDVR